MIIKPCVEVNDYEFARVVKSLDVFMTELQSMADEFDKPFIGLVELAMFAMMEGLGLNDDDDESLDGFVMIRESDS